MVDWKNKAISIKRQAKLLQVNCTSLYYKPVAVKESELALMLIIRSRFSLMVYRQLLYLHLL